MPSLVSRFLSGLIEKFASQLLDAKILALKSEYKRKSIQLEKKLEREIVHRRIFLEAIQKERVEAVKTMYRHIVIAHGDLQRIIRPWGSQKERSKAQKEFSESLLKLRNFFYLNKIFFSKQGC